MKTGIFYLSMAVVTMGLEVFGDYDLDGDLDILFNGRYEANVFRNDGNDIFTDTEIIGTLTASQTYTDTDAYTLNNTDKDRNFQDSFGVFTWHSP